MNLPWFLDTFDRLALEVEDLANEVGQIVCVKLRLLHDLRKGLTLPA